MPTIHLVRHGEVLNPNHVCYSDLPSFNLSERGVLQAHAAGHHLARERVDVVVTSPLARAVQTATSIASRHGLEPQQRNGLLESGQYPGWTGERWDDIRTKYPEQISAYLEDATSMRDVSETIDEIAHRVADAVEQELAGGAEVVVAVAHQDPVQAARLFLIGRPLSELLIDPPVHASVTTLEGSPHAGWRETAHWVPET